MSFAKMNKSAQQTVAEGIETEKLEYRALKDFVGMTIEVAGYYTHSKGKFGEELVVIGREAGTKELYKINMPKWAIEDFKGLTEEQLAELLEGRMRLTDVHKKTTKNGTTVAYVYDDGEPIRF